MKNIIGIYTITNTFNGKIYVGKSINVVKRLNDHLRFLQYQIHPNIRLQCAWNEFDNCVFEFEILEECEEQFLQDLENYWCNLLDTHNPKRGYNISPIKSRNIKFYRKTRQKIEQKINNSYIIKTRKPILQFDLSGNFIKEWDSIGSAGIGCNLPKSSLRRALQGKYKRAGKFIWKFKNIIHSS